MDAVVPAYFHPLVHRWGWQQLAGARPDVRAVILNSADGPGACPDPALRAAAARLRMPVLGYVDTGYGRRGAYAVERDIVRHLAWYPISGIFFDQVAAGGEWLEHYRRLAVAARRRGCTMIMFHHGVYPDPGFAELADVLGVFEGPARHHVALRAPAWARRSDPAKFCHLVYDTPVEILPEVLGHAADCGAGSVYPTDRGGTNPWDELPSYFPRLGAVP